LVQRSLNGILEALASISHFWKGAAAAFPFTVLVTPLSKNINYQPAMKPWILATAIALSFPLWLAASENNFTAHQELIDKIGAVNEKVELYWAAPSNAQPSKKYPAIIYVHGVQDESHPGAINMVNGGLLQMTSELGYFAVATSMPGYGHSSGKRDFCGRDSQVALQSVVQYLRTRPDVDVKNIAVSGISCGATTSAMIADKESLAAMILISGVYEFKDMYLKWHTPEWKLEPGVIRYIDESVAQDGGIDAAAKYRSALINTKDFKSPILVIAGRKDPIVDHNQSATFAKAIEGDGYSNEFVLNAGGGHMISYEDWSKYATDFLKKHLQ